MNLRYFVNEKEVTYSEWKIWYENYIKEEREKLIKWLIRR